MHERPGIKGWLHPALEGLQWHISGTFFFFQFKQPHKFSIFSFYFFPRFMRWRWMPSESWLLLWQTLPLTAFVLIQPGCHKAHCGSSTQWAVCWAGPEQLCQRGTFCFTVMSKSVSLVPYREMLLWFCRSVLYMVMKGERFPWATPHGTQCLSTYLCMSASLVFTLSAGENTLFSMSWDHACISITASYWCPK